MNNIVKYTIYAWKPEDTYARILKRNIESERMAETEGQRVAASGIYSRVEIREGNTTFSIQAWVNCYNPELKGILV